MTKKPKPIRRNRRKLHTDKWIVGMIEADGLTLSMFGHPTVHTDYDTAVAAAERGHLAHGKTFVVFAKKCVVGFVRPPVMKTEFLA